jgi:hypothetical protein
MKFTCTVEVDISPEQAAALFTDKSTLKDWQNGFVSAEPLSGTEGAVGSKAKLTYDTGKHRMELLETVKVNDLPREFTALYEHEHMTNTMTNRFIPLAGGGTRVETDIHYIKFNGFMPKLMSFIMPGMFRKQTQKWLDEFKAFTEKNK